MPTTGSAATSGNVTSWSPIVHRMTARTVRAIAATTERTAPAVGSGLFPRPPPEPAGTPAAAAGDGALAPTTAGVGVTRFTRGVDKREAATPAASTA